MEERVWRGSFSAVETEGEVLLQKGTCARTSGFSTQSALV